MNRFFASAATLALLTITATSAVAQQRQNFNGHQTNHEQAWLQNRKYREGAGIRVGDFELHPGIGVDFGYESNFLRRHSSEDPIGTLRLRASPHFSMSTLGAQRRDDGELPDVAFRADLGATYSEFFPVSGPQTGQDNLREQRNLGGDLKIGLDLFPGNTWSGRLYAGVGRTFQPTNEADLDVSFNRIRPTGGAELRWAPGSGLVDWNLGYQFSGTFFESSAFAGIDSLNHTITTRGRWRFLPRTALMFDANLGFVSYPTPRTSATNKTGSRPLRARIGFNGLVTRSFSVTALVGWGASFYFDDDQDFDSIIAQAELKWFLTPATTDNPLAASSLNSVAVGFTRDFEDAYLGTYLERNQGYARFNYLFGGAFYLLAEGKVGAIVWPTQTNPTLGNPDGWTDVRADARLFGEYRVTDYLGFNADIQFQGYFSDTTLSFSGFGDRLGFTNFKAFLGARLFL